MSKLFVLGIDGAFPEYIFGEWRNELPNINKLMQNGVYARLDSPVPCLSATAWSSILTGKPPADTGIFEYIQRKRDSYEEWRVISSHSLKEKTVWQILSDNGKESVACYPILSWPIKPFKGSLISGSLTPSGKDVENVYPAELKKELEGMFGEVPTADIPLFRDLSKEQIIEGVQKLTDKQIEVEKYLMKNKKWDMFFALIGLSDRMNHAFWRYMDNKHRKYDPNSPFKDALKNFYLYVDKKLGEFLQIVGEDTRVIVLSDHGITRLHTRVNLTDWLIKEGYMTLKQPITEKTRFTFDMVDWSKTRVFAIGAYEGQIFINLKGREPEGIVEQADYDSLLEEVIAKIAKISGDDGNKLETKFFRKKDHFNGKHFEEAPDAIIYFDDLEYGCNTTLIGNETMWSPQTALGSDDAGHSKQGIFIMSEKGKERDLGDISYLDVAPTILHLLGVPVPEDMKGKILK